MTLPLVSRVIVAILSLSGAVAFAPPLSLARTAKALIMVSAAEEGSWSRRGFVGFGASLSASALLGQTTSAFAAPSITLDETKKVVGAARTALEPIPELLKSEKWDAVRTILKIEVGKFWALGEAQNPVVQFAKGTARPFKLWFVRQRGRYPGLPLNPSTASGGWRWP